MNEEQKIFKGLLFYPGDTELKVIKRKAHNLNIDYNTTYEDNAERRNEIIQELVGSIEDGFFFQGPIFFHYGVHTHIGKNFFANFNLTIQDDTNVYIGDYCDFGPNVTIVTPIHPMIAQERQSMLDETGTEKRLCYAKPVKIGNRCWLCANVTVCPGVTIGDNCVIGAGSVVTKDIPDNSFAVGVPCKVIRTITEGDSMKYKHNIIGNSKVIL